ncbi:uncharacterized protein LOC133134684 [Conger conger]|uniref:uncharacterized protein LOC133134684 n=1 Tax=Conger conger TaxID=82655 RepID=UPI002A59F058|nr:uncharacterized protein LOC133134684 [Conger conger]
MAVVGGSAGWLFVGLCFGAWALAETDAGFSQCSQSFYKGTPPGGLSGGHLQARCHRPGSGPSFASLHSTSCDSPVLSAFCLRRTWGGTHAGEDGGPEEDTEDVQVSTRLSLLRTGTEEQDESQSDRADVPVTTPALLRRDGYNLYASPDTPANLWDALLSELVRNTIHPQCGALGGDLYVLTGRGAAGEWGQGCEPGLFWSAMCCVVPDDVSVFNVGVVKVGEEEARVLDVKGLEEVVGVEGAFSGDCGEAGGGGGGGVVTIALFKSALQQVAQMHDAAALPDSSDGLAESATLADSYDTLTESATLADSYDTLTESATQADSYDTLTESATQDDSSDTLTESATQAASYDTLTESATQADSYDTLTESATQADSSDTLTESATQAASYDTLTESATQPDPVEALAESSLAESAATQSADAPSEEAEGGSATVRSGPLSTREDPNAHASAPKISEEPQGNSTLLYLLSCSLWLITAPLRPVTSTLAQLPGQVTHVIQEDLAVLSSLPGGACSIVYNVVGDAALGALGAVSLAGRAGAACVSQVYACTSPLVGTLLTTCQEGVTGVGTLTSDGAGILGWVSNRAWSVSKYFGGRTWEQSRDFLWAVLGELGSQSKRVGGGLGKLALRGGKGVANTVCLAGRVVGGVVTVAVETVKEVFGDD